MRQKNKHPHVKASYFFFQLSNMESYDLNTKNVPSSHLKQHRKYTNFKF